MNTFDLSLDLSKSRNVNPIRLRQGDLNGTTIRALIFDHGALADLSGTTARWVMRLPGGEEYYRKTATVDATACTVTVEVDETQAASVSGRCRGYFQILDGSTVIASTGDVLVEVLPDALEGATVAESYDSAIQDAIDALDAAVEAIPDTVEDVLEAHPEWVTTVQDGAVTDAKLYHGAGGILARNQRLMHRLDNLLTAALPEGDSATATDAAQTPPAGLSLYGRSTQDGAPTPSAPVAIESVGGNLLPNNGSSTTSYGVTFTVNADGSVTCSGTATAQARFDIGRDVTTLPAGTYVCGEGTGSGYSIDVYKVVEGTATRIRSGFGTFTLDAETSVFVRIVVASGATVSATISPYIYAGSTPLPYVPFGCAGLWARGKNLLNPAQAFGGVSYYTVNADGTLTVTAEDSRGWTTLPVAPLGAGTYTLSIGDNEGGRVSFRTVVGDSEVAHGIVGNGSEAFTLTSDGGIKVKVHQGTFPRTVRIQVEAGSTATAYQPYAESVTHIDLDGHELRSLPDGTRDELTVGADGRVTLVQRVGSVDLGTLTWSYDSNGYFYSDSLTDKAFGNYNILSDAYAVTSATSATGMSSGEIKGHASAVRLFAKNSAYTTAAAFKTAVSGVTLLYALATPQTIDLGWTDAIPLCGPDLTAQAVPSAPFALTYERDLNVTLARLEAALAALA